MSLGAYCRISLGQRDSAEPGPRSTAAVVPSSVVAGPRRPRASKAASPPHLGADPHGCDQGKTCAMRVSRPPAVASSPGCSCRC